MCFLRGFKPVVAAFLALLCMTTSALATSVTYGFGFGSETDDPGQRISGYIIGTLKDSPTFGPAVAGAEYFIPYEACVTQNPAGIGTMCLGAETHKNRTVTLIDGKFTENSWFDGGFTNLWLGPDSSVFDFIFTWHLASNSGEPLKDDYSWTANSPVQLFQSGAPVFASVGSGTVQSNLAVMPLPSSVLVLLSAIGGMFAWARTRSRRRDAIPA